MKNLSFYKIEIEPDKNKRIDQLIASELPEYSRSRIKNWINRKDITINGKPCSPKDKILKKSVIEIRILENEELDIQPEKINLNISYEDKDILVINKNPGRLTHTAPGHFLGTLQNALLYHYPNLKNVPRAGIIHRLDKNTSGLIIIARNLIAHNSLVSQMKDKMINSMASMNKEKIEKLMAMYNKMDEMDMDEAQKEKSEKLKLLYH